MLYVTTNPNGPPTVSDAQGTYDLMLATQELNRARWALVEAEYAEQDAREKAAERIKNASEVR